MSAITNTNEYLEELRKEIELLNSVRICELYGGELDIDDVEKLKIDLRVAEKCHCFVDLSGVNYTQDNVHKGVYADLNIQIYAIGVFDRKTKGHSLDCSNCIEEIISYVSSKSSSISNRQPGFVQLGQSEQLANAIRKDQRFSIWFVNFIQRIRIS